MQARRTTNSLNAAKSARRALCRLLATTAGLATVVTGGVVSGLVNSGSAAAATTTATAAATKPAPPAPVFGNPYYLASATGAVWPLGGAPNYGSLAGVHLKKPVVGIALTPDHKGYWLVASDGGVFSFGDARFYGSTGNVKLTKPIIGMTTTPDGRGYWLFAGDGGVFTFGDARFYGSTGNVKLVKPIVGMTTTPDAKGYWLYAGDGGIFTFGDARFHGSTGNVKLVKPIIGMAASADARGYWLVASDGGVFTFGDARFYGSLGSPGTSQPTAQIVAAPRGSGYWEVAHDGNVYPFGSARQSRIPTIALLHTIITPGDVAMEWAMAQLGRPYQWGGTGPASFDCSGLVMEAWAAAGVTIPRVAADQYGYGTHLAISQLRIGDLVYWASNPAQPSTIYHVAMYIGGDQMVEAPHTGAVIHTDWIGGPGFVASGTRP